MPSRFKRMPKPQKWEQKDGLWQPVLLEEHVLKEIVERLWMQARIKMWRIRERIPGKGSLSTAGIPDLIGHIPARSFACGCSQDDCVLTTIAMRPTPLYIEVKRPGGARRIAQIRFIEEAKSDGCAAFFAESWLDVVRELYPFNVKLSSGQ